MTHATEACARLARTRASLRLAVREISMPAEPVRRSPLPAWMESLWRRLKTTPGTRTVVQGVDDWADQSPLPGIAMMAVDAADATLRPLVQRSPLWLVAGAMATGAMLAWSRPWRWIVTPALAAAVLPRLLLRILGGGAGLPWVSMLAALVERKPAQRQR